VLPPAMGRFRPALTLEAAAITQMQAGSAPDGVQGRPAASFGWSQRAQEADRTDAAESASEQGAVSWRQAATLVERRRHASVSMLLSVLPIRTGQPQPPPRASLAASVMRGTRCNRPGVRGPTVRSRSDGRGPPTENVIRAKRSRVAMSSLVCISATKSRTQFRVARSFFSSQQP